MLLVNGNMIACDDYVVRNIANLQWTKWLSGAAFQNAQMFSEKFISSPDCEVISGIFCSVSATWNFSVFFWQYVRCCVESSYRLFNGWHIFPFLAVCLCLNSKVILWRSRVTRQVIDNLKSYQKPNQLVGHIIEMAMVLVGCRPSNTTRESAIVYPNGEEQSGKFSQSSGSTNAVRRSNHTLITCFLIVFFKFIF